MTALKPIEWRHVKGVPSTKYPINARCAHPDCTEFIDGVHHIFPRSQIGNASYFVEITPEDGKTVIIPHAIGLCGSGTMGHHGDVEEHRAWIKLEDGEFIWYDRKLKLYSSEEEMLQDRHERGSTEEWVSLGPLNPQPGSREGKPKRKRTVKGTPARTERKTVSLRLPEGVSGDDWDALVEEAEQVELSQPDTSFDRARGSVTIGKLIVVVLERFTGRAG